MRHLLYLFSFITLGFVASVNVSAQTRGTVNGHEWVDLGLPSGTKWATCNVGASNPSDFGNYYAWGETSPKTTYWESNYSINNCKISDFAGNEQYDAAKANWGSSWEMPTKAKFDELRNNCTWTWTTQDGHAGCRVTGPNGNSIFLPAADNRLGSSQNEVGEHCFYWSSTPSNENTDEAFSLFCYSGGWITSDGFREWGYSIRAVLADNNVLAQSFASGNINGHEWVDLGLPSGTKWATCNIGALTPSDYGDYFAWGETTTKGTYTEENSVTYNLNFGDIVGDARFDAARANWGAPWHLPTLAQFEELKSNCTWTWVTQNGHAGYKATGPNGNSIFLPAAGFCRGTLTPAAGDDGNYSTSIPHSSNKQYSYEFSFFSGCPYTVAAYRYDGWSVRPVAD